VRLVERDAVLARALTASAHRLKATNVQIICADAIGWMSHGEPAGFDLVLLDPPFDASLGQRALALAAPLVAPAGFIYLEAGAPLEALPPGFEPWRSLRAGVVHAQLLRRSG
jgi:16S rRNA G966 N2-methylase RsmD